MLLSKPELVRMLRGVAEIWTEHKDELSEIDSRFGDGDHGVTIGKIAAVIGRDLDGWQDDDAETFLEDLGDDIMAVGGGSAGPLYGTMIGGLAGGIPESGGIGAGDVKKMLAASLEAMEDITTAKVGDKTMMDALIPAVEAAAQAEGDVPDVLKAAMEAAAQGAKKSEEFVSKFGRAKSYKEQTIGTPDAGAMSTALFFKGLWNGLTE
ncbi:Dak phosphatase [Lachnoclostridium sp. An14]|uniref:DAK2 domain-containing protein n=1 Tax=Lachnoclostridium sp. An14 TaxID=1965562 RepID=UPI000B37C118|nr:DAK2 domain-containing protein [Lachnoclostridium sp. An14]OUQ13316.1 Dak phosphatase [Lachnoclostridium sp. An14]